MSRVATSLQAGIFGGMKALIGTNFFGLGTCRCDHTELPAAIYRHYLDLNTLECLTAEVISTCFSES
jgi:hypothetical protein